MSVRVIQLLAAGQSVTVGQYGFPFYESGPGNHSFEWDEKGAIYLSSVPNSVAKVKVGTGTAVLNAGNGRTYSWTGRAGVYDVTYLWKGNGSVTKYVDLYRFAAYDGYVAQTLIRQSVYLIISVGGIFCPVNMDIW